ncbi:OLC1v1012310C4 [Oldenlandia corymbosa var. corymbosa]|uniref:OLC1v1012310C4 n=1 Tax=Oldenlandia corymbosa var. corymbosa TaxID=529605 RepID=A0AAV1DVQ1_OLDCO|nr:OLC1v1012310C4 [Oldenlandia corymbosa var. corymbosa]
MNNVVGVRFRPIQEELVGYFLKKKVSGDPFTEQEKGYFAEVNLYGPNSNPWEVLTDDHPWHLVMDPDGISLYSQKNFYVFTRLSSDNVVGKTNRVAGCGTWVADSPAEPVIDNHYLGSGKKIGEYKTFKFESSVPEQSVGRWTMVEFSIDAAANGIPAAGESIHSDYVLCKLIDGNGGTVWYYLKKDFRKCIDGGGTERVMEENGSVESHKVLYILTHLSSNNVAGCGTWNANSPAEPVTDHYYGSGQKIGECKAFPFESPVHSVQTVDRLFN